MRWLLLLLFLSVTCNLFAIEPVLALKKRDKLYSLPLKKLDIVVDVVGDIATTTMILSYEVSPIKQKVHFFKNVTPTQKGYFYLPLNNMKLFRFASEGRRGLLEGKGVLIPIKNRYYIPASPYIKEDIGVNPFEADITMKSDAQLPKITQIIVGFDQLLPTEKGDMIYRFPYRFTQKIDDVSFQLRYQGRVVDTFINNEWAPHTQKIVPLKQINQKRGLITKYQGSDYFYGSIYCNGLKLIKLDGSKKQFQGLYHQQNRDQLRFGGKLLTQKGEIILSFHDSAGKIVQKSVSIGTKREIGGEQLVRWWLHREIEALNRGGVKNRAKIVALGKKYRIETPFTTIGQISYGNHQIPKRHRQELKRRNIAEAVTLFEQLKGWYQHAVIKKAAIQRGLRCVTIMKPRFSTVFKPSLKAKNMKQGGWNDQTFTQFKQFQGNQLQYYQKIAAQYRNNIAFYLDVSDYFRGHNKIKEAVMVLNDLIKRYPDHYQVVVVAGYRLLWLKRYQESDQLFQKLYQSTHFQGDLLWIMAEIADLKGAYQRAADLLYQILISGGNSPYRKEIEGIKLIALEALNRVLVAHPELNQSKIDAKVVHKIDADFKVEFYGDSLIPIKLTLIDSNGLHANGCGNYTENRLFYQGVNHGYRPGFLLGNKMKSGRYTLELTHSGRYQGEIPVGVTAYIIIYHHYNQKDERIERLMVPMADRSGKTGAKVTFVVE